MLDRRLGDCGNSDIAVHDYERAQVQTKVLIPTPVPVSRRANRGENGASFARAQRWSLGISVGGRRERCPCGGTRDREGTFFSLKDNASLLRVQSLDNPLDGLLGHVVHHAAADKVEDDMALGCASCQHRPEVPLGPASRATFRTSG